MDIFEIHVELPAGLRVEQTTSSKDCVCINLVGAGSASFALEIAKCALRSGFQESAKEADLIKLCRGEQRVLVIYDQNGMTIQTDDPTKLPKARFEGSMLLIGDLRLDCGTGSIEPLRQEIRAPQLLTATWKIFGVTPRELRDRVLESAVVSEGLKLGSRFEPPVGGELVWTGKAYSGSVLVHVGAISELNHVRLEIDLVDKR